MNTDKTQYLCFSAFKVMVFFQTMPCEIFLFLLYSKNKMYYSDYVENRIYSASLDTGGDAEVLLDDNVEVPGKTGGASL